jgi:hypothetical protein
VRGNANPTRRQVADRVTTTAVECGPWFTGGEEIKGDG